jgi:hypothetical protein
MSNRKTVSIMTKRVNTDELNESLIIASVRNRAIVPENKPAEVSNSVQNSQATQLEQPKPVEQPKPAKQPEPVEQPEQPELLEQPKPLEQSEQAEETSVTPEPQKEETRNKRASHMEYESRFIRETDLPPARFGKSVYIRKEYHDRISQIISVIGGNEVSIFGYIDNVLEHHFEYFQDDITRSFKKKIIFK